MFNAFELKTVDWVFLGCFTVLLVILIIFLIIKKVNDIRTAKILKQEFANLSAQDKAKLENNPVDENQVEDVVATATPSEEFEVVENKEEVKKEDKVVEEKTTKEPEVVKVEEESKVEEEAKVEPEVVEVEKEEESKEEVLAEDVDDDKDEERKGRSYDGKYEIYQENNYYRYRLKASNGEILFVSEMYTSRLTVIKAIDNLKRNLSAGRTDVFADKKKNYKFKLTASNNRVMAISANYPSEKGAQSALESFKRFAMTNDIVDIELPAEQIDSQLVEITKIKEEDKKGGKYVIKKDINKEFSWELKANNGEILCQHSGYSSKNSVENAIAAFKENVVSGKFYLSKDKSNNYQFKLYSQSGRLANIGESYDSSNAVYSVVTSILNFASLANVVDHTKQPAKKPGQKQSLKKTTKK